MTELSLRGHFWPLGLDGVLIATCAFVSAGCRTVVMWPGRQDGTLTVYAPLPVPLHAFASDLMKMESIDEIDCMKYDSPMGVCCLAMGAFNSA